MKRLWARALLCGGLAGCLAGCGKSPGSAPVQLPDPPRVVHCDPGKTGGRLTLALVGSPHTFNPLLITNSASETVTRMLFSSLITLDLATKQPSPGLAESWGVEARRTNWTFRLRKNLHWSDGQPLTAADVTFTWNKVMYNPAYNPFLYDVFRVNGRNFQVTNDDDLTVRVTVPEVFAPFLEYFGTVAILPQHILADAVNQDHFLLTYAISSRPERIVGSGPFRLKRIQPGKLVLLERNPWYGAVDTQGQRLPYFDEIMFDVTENSPAAADLFLHGKCDTFEFIRPESWNQFKVASAPAKFRLIELGAGLDRDFLWFNQNTGTDPAGKPFVNPVKLKWFRDRRFRKAVAFALDRDRIAREAYGGRATAPDSLFGPENVVWNNTNAVRYTHDPAKARALLAEMGLEDRTHAGVLTDPDGNAVTLTLYSNVENPARVKIARLICDDLRQVGIKADCQLVDFATMGMLVNATLNYECALMGFGGGGTDPASQVNLLKSSEPLHQWFPMQKTPSTDWEARIDSLIDAQMRTFDFAERKRYFDEVQAIWADEQPMICVAAAFSGAAVRSNIGNVHPAIGAGAPLTWNIEELFFQNR